MALPASHDRHDELLDAPLEGFQVPAAHGTKTCRIESAPGVGQKPPDGQSAHSVASATSETLPAAQTVQLVLAFAALNVPGEHGMQLSIERAPGKRCLVPGWQSIGVTVRIGQYCPTGHSFSRPHVSLSLVFVVATKPAMQSRRQVVADEKFLVNWPVRGIQVPNGHVHIMGPVDT